MRKWKRVQTADGPRFRSSLAPHEADLLRNLVGALIDLLEYLVPMIETEDEDSALTAIYSLAPVVGFLTTPSMRWAWS